MLAVTLAVLAQAAAPLPPTGKWVVQGDNNMCALLHSFGDDKDAVTLGIRPWPLGGKVDIMIWILSNREGVEHAAEHMTIDAAVPLASGYVSVSLDQNHRVAIAPYPDAIQTSLADAKSLTIALGHERTVQLALPDMKPALHALEGCKPILFKNLGIAADWPAKMATAPSPIGDDDKWFVQNDYPENPLDGGVPGTSNLLLTIGAKGRVTQCVTFGSSGSVEMDAAACKAFQKRGQYHPAKDAQGQPIESYIYRGVSWVTPI